MSDAITPPSIVIIQTSRTAYMVCDEQLGDEFRYGRDFVLVNTPEVAERAIIPGHRQMLVTGTFGGDQTAADAFVRRMKAKNPNLVAVSFSSLDVTAGEPYDVVVQKGFGGNFCSDLINRMQCFLVEC